MSRMKHEEAIGRDLAEAYVQRRLSEAEEASFEEHFYGCEECFAEVESLQKMAAGVKDQAHRSFAAMPVQATSYWSGWQQPAFALACAASLVLATFAGWMQFVERPGLESLAMSQKKALEESYNKVAELEATLAMATLATAKPPQADANLPLAMLEASRAGGTGLAVQLGAAAQLALWVEVPEAKFGAKYVMVIRNEAGEVVQRLEGLLRNSYGALAVSVPAAKLSPGNYQARVELVNAKPALVGEYRFSIRN